MFKKFILVSSSGLLKLTLLGLALAGAGWMTFGSPDTVKKAAEESNIYSGIVDGILDTAAKDAQASTDQSLPINDPAVQQIAKNAFPAETLSTHSESIIDGIYSWLQGTSETPQFSVDLSDSKQRLAGGLADYAQQRYEALPACTLNQLRTIDPNNIDPFNAPCRAPQVPASMVRERVYNEIATSDAFLNETEFTAENLPKDEQGRTVVDNLQSAPDAYNAFRILPWLLALISAALIGVIIMLHENKIKAFKSIGITFLGTGIFLAIGALLINWSFKQLNPPNDALAYQTSLINMVRSLSDAYNSALMRFYLTYLIVGGVILLTVWYRNRNRVSITSKSTK